VADGPPVNVTVSRGGAHSCAVRHDDGTVLCWGSGPQGQLGHRRILESREPVLVDGLEVVVAVSAGAGHACATERSGIVKCWGSGQYGQLGYGGVSNSADPRRVTGIDTAVDADAGGSHVCALETSGAVKCWGLGEHGQLGQGTAKSSRYPLLVPGLEPVISVCAGAEHSCAVEASGRVRCWGWNAHSQLGDPDLAEDWSASLVLVANVADAEAVICGHEHTCAKLQSGRVQCWGTAVRGQIEQQDQQQFLWRWTSRADMLLADAVAARDWRSPFGSMPSHVSFFAENRDGWWE